MVRSRLLGGIILCVVCSSLCRHERAETRSYAKMSVADDSGHGSETMRIYVPRPVDVNFAEQDAFPGEASSHGRLSDLEAAAKSGTDVSRKSVHLDSDNPSEDAIDGIESTTELESVKERADAAAEEEKDMAIRHSDSPPSISTYNKHCATPANDIKLPMCRFCKSTSFDAVTIYLEEFHALNLMYWNSYTEREKQFPEACKMPDGMKCILQHSDTMADVVFRMQWYIRNALPVRYCYPQILSILNSEAEGPGYHERPQVKHAEVHIDFHITSEVLIADGCRIKSYRKAMETWSPPNPSEHHGIVMFLSHCKGAICGGICMWRNYCNWLRLTCMVVAFTMFPVYLIEGKRTLKHHLLKRSNHTELCLCLKTVNKKPTSVKRSFQPFQPKESYQYTLEHQTCTCGYLGTTHMWMLQSMKLQMPLQNISNSS